MSESEVADAAGRRGLWDLLWVRGLGRALALILIAPIKVYQHLVSPLLPASCKYHPSCSAYAVGALRGHGPLKGTALTLARLLRCNPWSRGGVDPVPSRGNWRPDVLPDGSARPDSHSRGVPQRPTPTSSGA